ncbi:MAG: type II toxin-antitoxin system HicA family toxin [Deltaproteobacteria bacterium]|nr:type II toxin-antitoxin system HicA family toxin [Deltaproteobacteria bacterium]
MAKLPRLSGKEVIEVFKRDGWVVDRIEGSHHIRVKAGREATLSVPIHGRKEIKL